MLLCTVWELQNSHRIKYVYGDGDSLEHSIANARSGLCGCSLADSKHADNARGRILALRDEQAWSAAQATSTIAAYEGYVKAWSGGVYVGDAQYQITALQRAIAWKAIQNDPSAASLQAFLAIYPQGLESNEARAKLSELDQHSNAHLKAAN
jgi:hypothetical protein